MMHGRGTIIAGHIEWASGNLRRSTPEYRALSLFNVSRFTEQCVHIQ